MHPCQQYMSLICLPLDLLPSPLSLCCLCPVLQCPMELRGCGWIPWAAAGGVREGRAQQWMGSKATGFCAFLGAWSPGPTLRVSLPGCSYHSNPSPGLCTRKGSRDPAANDSAESLGRRGRKFFSCLGFCSFFRIKVWWVSRRRFYP